jgi:CHAD domain-containing protein
MVQAARPKRSRQTDVTAGDVLRHSLLAEAERLYRHEAGLCALEEVAVHQSRVAMRRLRSHVRTFRPLLVDGWADVAFGELAGLRRSLGPMRDVDVSSAWISAAGGDLRPTVDVLIADLAAERARIGSGVRLLIDHARYPSLLATVANGASAPGLSTSASASAESVLLPMARRAWRSLKRRADALTAATDAEAFHDVRILVKRARYAIDLLDGAPTSDDRRLALREVATQLAAMQSTLGGLQDGVLVRDRVFMAAARRPDDGPLGMVAGVLLEREATRARAARAEFLSAWSSLRPYRPGRLLEAER